MILRKEAIPREPPVARMIAQAAVIGGFQGNLVPGTALCARSVAIYLEATNPTP